MRLGLGTGSTAERFLRSLGRRIESEALQVTGVATSERTSRLAQELGIPLITLDEAGALDLSVDGADEADGALRLIKGGGGALLREKLVASAARRSVILVDPSKKVDTLGRFPLPVEVVGFGARQTLERIGALIVLYGEPGGVARLRLDNYGEPFVTDGGNLIIDAAFGGIRDPEALGKALDGITGVVEHGLFLGLCDTLVIGMADGSTQALRAKVG
jgi:ribose 5-phosphate isomerase A